MSRRSLVWQHFEKINARKVQCGLCGNLMAFAGSTTAMLTHLHRKHPMLPRGSMPASAPSPASDAPTRSVNESEQLQVSSVFSLHRTCDAQRAEAVSQLLTEMAAKDLLPLSFVGGEGFRALLAFLEPEYAAPSPQAVARRVHKLYEEVKAQVRDDLDQAAHVAVTTDVWRSAAADAYLTVTAHWIDADWRLRSAVLDTRGLEPRPTGGRVALCLGSVIDAWGLSAKVAACVRDGASDEAAAGQDGSRAWPDLACSAHELQLAVNEGLKTDVLHSLAAAVSDLVAHFERSAIAAEAFETAQDSLQLPRRRLIRGDAASWSSVHEMFERAVEQRQAICFVLSERDFTDASAEECPTLTPHQWQLIASLLPTLKSLRVATAVMSYESNTPVSSILPVISGLLRKHLIAQPGDNGAVTEFKAVVADQLRLRFARSTGVDDFCIRASVLDPRHKELKFLDDSSRAKAYDSMRRSLQEGRAAPAEEPPHKKVKESAMLFLLPDDYFSGKEDCEGELDRYLQAPSLDPSSDPLAWWRANGHRFPSLSVSAAKYLCCPATAAPAERVFSPAADVVSRRRCLGPDDVDRLIFLNKNLK